MDLETLSRNLKEARWRVVEARKEQLPSDSIYILRCQTLEAWKDFSRARRRDYTSA